MIKNCYLPPLKPRNTDSNKGTFGTLLNMSGSDFMIGALYFSSVSALKTGIGLLCIANTKKVIRRLSTTLFEPVYIKRINIKRLLNLRKFTAVLAGCGMGNTKKTKKIIKGLLKNCNIPLVIDADGLNSIAKKPSLLKVHKQDLIITPHLLEFSRLCKKEVSDITMADGINFAKENNLYLVLKSHITNVFTPSGEVFELKNPTAALSKGGTGDVLAGLISGFLATGESSLDSIMLGLHIHNKAGHLAEEQINSRAILTSDIINFINSAY